MFKGTFYGIAACFIWGLIFILPDLMVGYDSFEIALGRHFINGSISVLLITLQGGFSLKTFPPSIWAKAFIFALIVNIGYYTCLVMAVKFASPAIAALIVGVSPIIIAFYGNWLEKECSYGKLIFPSLLILTGLLLINLPLFFDEEQDVDKPFYILGILGAVFSMLAWSWYVVTNSRFLKSNPEISAQDWSTVIGVCTFIWAIGLGIAYESWLGAEHWDKFIAPSPLLWNYLAGCAILGIMCSWFGTFLWNKASTLLPVSFAGQITIFETIFGLLFFYLLKQESPPPFELAGASLMLLAIFYGINTFATQQSHAG